MKYKDLAYWLEPALRYVRRGRRKFWTNKERCHIELRELSWDELQALSPELDRALGLHQGVAWARVNPYLGRVVAQYDGTPELREKLVREVERVEAQMGLSDHPLPVRDPEQHPGDAAPIRRVAVELAAEIASLLAGTVLDRIGFKPLALGIDLAALLRVVETLPALRKTIERAVSIASTELGLELGRALAQTLLQGRGGPIVGILHLSLRMRELIARRRLWEACEPELCADPACYPGSDEVPREPRPRPRQQGPVEQYTNRASRASLGIFGLAFLGTRSLESASSAIFAGVPRQAQHGRDAFAAHFAVRLARAGILVIDPHVLRKLERLDTAVMTGELLGEADARARELVTAVRRAGLRLVVAESTGDEATWARPEEISASTAHEVVRSLQARGHRVCFISCHASPALAEADCGIGLCAAGPRPPWGAHVFCRSGVADAVFVLDGITAARRASRQSVRLSMGEAGLGAMLAFYGLDRTTTQRIMAAANATSILSMANAIRIAHSVERRAYVGDADTVPWHSFATGAVLEQVASRPEGLREDEAAARRVPPPSLPSPLAHFGRMFFEELANPMAPILIAGAGLSAMTGSVTDAALITGVLVINGAFGGVQRYRTERALLHMARSEKHKVRVRRGGAVVLGESTLLIDSTHLVPGDVIELEAGDVVPADCRILEAIGLEVDESSLTGESLPVAKNAEPSIADAVAERSSMLYDGTSIAAGQASAVVVAVGEATEARRALAGAKAAPESGVERRLASLTALTAPVAAAGGIVLAAAGLIRGQPARNVISTGVSLAVAAVPEGLPLLATLAQLAAASRLSRRGALVRNPRAIEALGRMDLLCADKTGTLTEGRICLRIVSDGESEQNLDELDLEHRRILAVAVRASPERRNGAELPHMTDRALVDGAQHVGVAGAEGVEALERSGELPFEPSRGYHAGLARVAGGHLISVKGAPEVVLPRCRSWRSGSIELTDAMRQRLFQQSMSLARRGHRVLAVAERRAEAIDQIADEHVDQLDLRGFVAFSDPIRQTARAAVGDLHRAGVDVVMITGDHPSTAEAIAVELGLRNGADVVTGPELDRLSDSELDRLLQQVHVFARVTPAQKVRVVAAFKRLGRVVAMTGDGANDAPAIRLADVGIAMGERSTAAAREAADLIVVDERIETIVHAALEGRALWASVREAVAMLVGGNLGEICFTVLGGLVSAQSPLNARQLLLVNLLTDSLPALAVALKPPAGKTPEELMREGPDASLGSALTREIGARAIVTGGATALAWVSASLTGTAERAGTVALLTLTGTQLTQTLLLGSRTASVLATGLGSLAALLAIVETPGLSQFFGCRPLGPIGLLQAAAATAVGTGAAYLWPRLARSAPAS
jgi:cation-transporting ATPase I